MPCDMEVFSTFSSFRMAARPTCCSSGVLRLLVGLACLVGPGPAQDVLTSRYDNARSGHQGAEAVLTPASIGYSRFGKVATFAVDGDVYAQPLYVSQYQMIDGSKHNVLFVATQHDWLYAFDANGNNPATGYLWRVSLLGAGETWLASGDVGTDDIFPSIGITGTPVIDRSGGILYVVAKSKSVTSQSLSGITQRLHAVSLADGSEKLNGPTVIAAAVPGIGEGGTVIHFNPLTQNQRPGLTLALSPGSASKNTVYIAWASHGDGGTYHGWVIGYNAADISQQSGAWANTPDGGQGGIWMSANGLAADSNGTLFVASGNGSFDANRGGRDFGSSLVKLTSAGSGITVQDWFAPHDTFSLNATDSDFGVSGPVLLPDQPGANPHLLVTSDKSGVLYLVNRDNPGHFNGSYNADLQEWRDGGYSIHSNYAWFNNQLYLAPDGGPVESYAFNVSTQLFGTTPQTKSGVLFGNNQTDGSGSNLVVSSNGTQNGVVWALDYHSYRFGPAILHAFDAANLGTELYNSSQAALNRDLGPIAVKFASPTVANGQVYVGGRNAVVAYGLLQGQLPVTPAPTYSIAGGTFTTAQTVSLNDAAAAATIYYTADGSTPTTSSSVYSAPVSITATTTLHAIALAPGETLSPLTSAAYVIQSVTPPPPTTISFPNGFQAGALQLNGFSNLNGSRLRLSDGKATESSSAFFPTPVNVQSFTSNFVFQLTNPAADGFTFVLQRAGLTATGPSGGGLGYGADSPTGPAGIPNSIAIKFDLYNNKSEGSDSTGLYLNGVSPTTPAIDLHSSGVNLHSGNVMAAVIGYDGTTLWVTLKDTATGAVATQTYPINISATIGGSSAYVGFTAGTGGLTATQEVLSWVFTGKAGTPPPPPPPPPPPSAQLTITSPVSGQVLLGLVNFTAQVVATLDAAGSYLIIDGQPFGRRVASAPYVYAVDTRMLLNGSHVVQLWGHNTGNQNLLSAPVTFVVHN